MDPGRNHEKYWFYKEIEKSCLRDCGGLNDFFSESGDKQKFI